MPHKFRYRSFCLGIIFTSMTWIIILYFYVSLNNGSPDMRRNQDGSIEIERDQSKKYVNNEKLVRAWPNLKHNIRRKAWPDKSWSRRNSQNTFEDYEPNHINIIARDEESPAKTRKPTALAPLPPPNVLHADLENLGLVKSRADKMIRSEGYRLHAFNALVSNRIGYHREIPDTRHALCRKKTYKKNLPSASIIICFYNEARSALLRTMHSVLDRTPSELLFEIILVDDFSSLSDLQEDLASYIEALPSKVSLIRTAQREGLIRARMFGAHQAKGQVLVFLDSHCEVNERWLEPLLARIHENRTTVVCPIIDIVNADTFAYSASPLVRGGFNWGLHFKWDSIPPQTYNSKEDYIKPIRSPTMAGGLFAIDRSFFTELGEYDPGMDIWGGENLEISFRVWMCGGILEIIPCSRVGHIFRKRRPYGSVTGEDTMLHNSLRVAHVWMEQYKEYFFETRPDARHQSYGNISDRVQLREKLKCHTFEWYLNNVYPELKIPSLNELKLKSVVTPSKKAMKNDKFVSWKRRSQNYVGQFKIQLTGTDLCLESENDPTVKNSLLQLQRCRTAKSQVWFETDKNEFLLAELLCLDAGDDHPRLAKCHDAGGSQEWKHVSQTNIAFYNMAAGLCLGVKKKQEGQYAYMEMCTKPDPTLWDLRPL